MNDMYLQTSHSKTGWVWIRLKVPKLKEGFHTISRQGSWGHDVHRAWGSYPGQNTPATAGPALTVPKPHVWYHHHWTKLISPSIPALWRGEKLHRSWSQWRRQGNSTTLQTSSHFEMASHPLQTRLLFPAGRSNQGENAVKIWCSVTWKKEADRTKGNIWIRLTVKSAGTLTILVLHLCNTGQGISHSLEPSNVCWAGVCVS